MTSEESSPAPTTAHAPAADIFVTTRWTVVLAAGRKSSLDSDQALSDLCRTYWFPLYTYIRRRGRSKEDAEDLTQSFLATFLEKNYLEGLSAERGKFRAFLLASLKHFLANEWNKSQRQKRGGGVAPLTLDWASADERFQLAQAASVHPDQSFDREWALALLERVIARLRAECASDGKLALFEQARGYLMVGEQAIPYAAGAEALGIQEGAMRVAVHRLRKRYRQLLRDEIAQTLDHTSGVEDELRALIQALAA